MAGLNFQIYDLVHADAKAPPSMPSAGANITLQQPASQRLDQFWDELSSTQKKAFTWDREDYGWDEAYWAGHPERFHAYLAEDVYNHIGKTPFTFTRASTAEQINDEDVVETVAANVPTLDYVKAPDRGSRHILRCDQTDALLTYPSETSLRRRKGSLTVWFMPLWHGIETDANDRIIWETGAWKLFSPANSKVIRFTLTNESGTSYSAEFDCTEFSRGTWYLIYIHWDRFSNFIKIGLADVVKQTTVTTGRFSELGDRFGVGQGVAAGKPCKGYLYDLRLWNNALSASDLAVVGAIATGGKDMGEVTVIGLTKIVEVTPAIVVAAYGSGDLVGQMNTLTDAMRVNGGTGLLQSVMVRDKSDLKPSLDIILLDTTCTLPADNAPIDILDADLGKVIAAIQVLSADYIDLGSGSIVTKNNLAIPVKSVSNSKNLLCLVVVRQAWTPVSVTDLIIRFGLLQD